MPVPLTYDKPAAQPKQEHSSRPSSGGPSAPSHPIVTLERVKLSSFWNPTQPSSDPPNSNKPCLDSHCAVGPTGPPDLFPPGPAIVTPPPIGPVRMSHMDEGLLLH